MTPTLTAPTRPRKPRPKPARTFKVLQRPHDGNPETVLKITVGKDTDYYRVEPISSDWGRAFAVVKMGVLQGEPDTVYHVNLSAPQDTCDCLGNERWGHCKHCEALHALIARGEL